MGDHDKKIERNYSTHTLSNLEKIDPHLMFMYLAMFGSALIFLFMIIAYSLSKPDVSDFNNFKFPKAFIVSMVLLLISSFSISKSLPAFENGNFNVVKKSLGITLILSIAFTICQYLGWYQLNETGIYLGGRSSGAYLYVISGLHVVHLVAGIIFLSSIFFQIASAAKDPVRQLMMETNPYQKIKLEILSKYWHYMDGLWIFLFFYFLFSF